MKKEVSLEQFILNIRWTMGLLAPLLFLTGDKPIDFTLIALFVGYNIVNLLHQVALLKKANVKRIMMLFFIMDLVLASMVIYNRGGFISDSFHGYYIFILISAIFYGVRTTLAVSIICAILYAFIGYMEIGAGLTMVTFIHRALTRGFFFILLGILTASLSSHREKQQKIIKTLEFDKIKLKKDVEESRERANIDGLTQIYNHRYFQERLAEEINIAAKTANKLSLLMIDIDYFKKFNDTYGHRKGDFILKELASLLTNLVRKNDTIARYGGEEFSAILPGCNNNLAREIAERIRKVVEEHNFDGLKVTISVGVATFDGGDILPENLIDIADTALYKAKEERNNVFSF